jgi:hypothetical protein
MAMKNEIRVSIATFQSPALIASTVPDRTWVSCKFQSSSPLSLKHDTGQPPNPLSSARVVLGHSFLDYVNAKIQNMTFGFWYFCAVDLASTRIDIDSEGGVRLKICQRAGTPLQLLAPVRITRDTERVLIVDSW